MSAGFRLTPQEDFVRGVSQHGTTLRFGASGTQLIEAALSAVGALIVGGFGWAAATGSDVTLNGFRVDHPAPIVVVSGAVAMGLLIRALGLTRSGVTATEEGLILQARWRRRVLAWGEVADLQSIDTTPERWAVAFAPGSAGLWMRPVASYSLGVAITTTALAVQLPSFRSAARGEGLSMGGPTPTELKIVALRRYREEVVGPWPQAVAPVDFDAMRSRSWPVVVWAVCSPPSLWVLIDASSDQRLGVEVLVGWWALALVGLAWALWRRRRVRPSAETRPFRAR